MRKEVVATCHRGAERGGRLGSRVLVNMRGLSRATSIVLFSLAAGVMALQILVRTIYLPLGVDGGWAAYPAVAMARGGSATENIRSIDELSSMKGIKIQHGFDDRSIRLFALAAWYRWFGHGHLSTRIFSILEYLILAALTYQFLGLFSRDKQIVLLVWSLYLTDSTLLGMTADLRPDILMAALAVASCLFFHRGMRNGRPIFFVAGVATSSILALVWPSSAVPVASVLVFVFWELGLGAGRGIRIRAGVYLILLAIPPASFLFRDQVNAVLFGPFDAYDRTWDPDLLGLWSKGAWFLLEKEVDRWRSYFVLGNIVRIIPFALAVGLAVRHVVRRPTEGADPRSVAAGLLAGIVVLGVFDKSDSSHHLIPLIPFMYALLVGTMGAGLPSRGKMRKGLAVIVGAAAIVGLGAGVRMWVLSERSGYRNAVVEQRISAAFTGHRENVLIVGPAALFPFFSNGENVTMIDDRNGTRLDRFANDSLERLRFILLDREYLAYGYEAKFRARWPMVELATIEEMGRVSSPYGYLKIIRVQR